MSTVSIHVGQCGIQLGEDIWIKKLSQKKSSGNHHVHFARDGQPHALFVDAEKKVLKHFSRRIRQLKLESKFDVHESSVQTRQGCGSNWAVGYHALPRMKIGQDVPKLKLQFGQTGADRDSNILETCLDSVRIKIEACESFSGFLGFQSLAGGTGSGFGSKLCEELRDSYPTAYRLWNVVLPFSIGEAPTQSYNQLLSLASLYQNADAIMLIENDAVLNLLAKTPDQAVSLRHMNEHICDALMGLYMPTTSLTPPGGGVSIGLEPWELIRSVAPMPSLKLLRCSHAKDANSTTQYGVWDKLRRSVLSQIKSGSSSGRCISSLFVARGPDPENMQLSHKHLQTHLKFVSWNPYPVDVWNEKAQIHRSITACTNPTSSGSEYCAALLARGRLMFDNRAYLHWYERYGVEAERFADAFRITEHIIDDYKGAE